MLVKESITDWAKAIDLEILAVSYCKRCINNYLNDFIDDAKQYFGEYCPEKIDLELKKVYAIIDWKEQQYSHIIALVPIVYDCKEIGRYELFFRIPSGEIYDDLLVIDGQEQLTY
ncbi:hypothetical protein ACFSR7_18730 [Cohnella sp. GCM10020058]|uniref:hypothetical protein n=1 Tax=Cohnella sp. GCM10020058 TaxID=3317330 RepID=UPI00362525F0